MTCLVAALSAVPLMGQEGGPFRLEMGVGLASVDRDEGFGFNLGFSGSTKRAQVRLVLPDLSWVLTDAKAGYERVDLLTGAALCKDLSTGEFVDDGPCDDWEARFGAMLDLSFSVLNRETPLRMGGGFRAGYGRGPYGLLSYGPNREAPGGDFFVEVRAGRDFYHLMIGMSFWPWVQGE